MDQKLSIQVGGKYYAKFFLTTQHCQFEDAEIYATQDPSPLFLQCNFIRCIFHFPEEMSRDLFEKCYQQDCIFIEK